MTFTSYCLVRSDSAATYVGATVNIENRLRQHNGLKKGGAKYTVSALSKGHTWDLVVKVSGFPTWRAALQFEWRWKNLSRKKRIGKSPLERRIKALICLVNLDRPASKSERYDSYAPLKIAIHTNSKETDELLSTVLINATIDLN